MATGDVSIQFNYPTSFNVVSGVVEGTLLNNTFNGAFQDVLTGTLGDDSAGALVTDPLSGQSNESGSGSLQ